MSEPVVPAPPRRRALRPPPFLERYLVVLRLPGVARLLLLSLFARLPVFTGGLVLTVHVVQRLHESYALAGLVGTASTVGWAIGGPWRGRMVDRLGLRRAIVPSIVAELVVWNIAPLVPYAGLVGLGFVGGLLALPIMSITRQSLSVMVPAGQRRAALSLDSVITELSYIVGPAVMIFVIGQTSTTTALRVIGFATGAVGIALWLIDPPTRSESGSAESSGERGPRRHVLADARFVFVLAVGAGAVFVLTGTELSAISALLGMDAQSSVGWVLGLWGLGSLVGGLVYGGLPRPVPLWVLLLGLGLVTLPAALANRPWQLGLLLVFAGCMCAPLLTAVIEAISHLVEESRRGEAMGWQGSAFTLGSATGMPLTGLAIDRFGPPAGFLICALVGMTLAACAGLTIALRRRR